MPNDAPVVAPNLYPEALAAFNRQDFVSAQQLLQELLASGTRHCEVLNLAAATALEQQNLILAESLWREAVQCFPEFIPAYSNLALVLQKQARYDEARILYQQAIAKDKNFSDAYFNLGLLHIQTNNYEEGIVCFDRVLSLNPLSPKALKQLGFIWLRKGELATQTKNTKEAITAYQHALKYYPQQYAAANNLGLIYFEQKNVAAAEALYWQAIQYHPNLPEAWVNLGNIYKHQRNLVRAEAAYRQALSHSREHNNALNNLALLLTDLQRYQEAETLYQDGLLAHPNEAETRLQYGLLLLRLGRYGEAWPFYAARFDPNRRFALSRPHIDFPQWQGEDLQGKSLLIIPEQGLGDELQLVRYTQELRRLGAAKITLLCAAPLQALFIANHCADTVLLYQKGMVFPSHDYWDFALDLPWHCGAEVHTLPKAIPYLQADPVRKATWQTRLAASKLAGSKLKIGVVWKGNPKHRNDANRSLPNLAALAPLWEAVGEEACFISLQKGEGEDEAKHAEQTGKQPLLALGHELADFADTAALLSQLDLLIAVDTSVVHLAGAMGIPCWVMLPAIHTDWRWGIAGEQSPWYPEHTRLFRPTDVNTSWETLVTEVSHALRTWHSPHSTNLPKPNPSLANTAVSRASPLPVFADANAANEFAMAAHTRGDTELAILAYQAACELAPTEGTYPYNLGTLYQNRGRFIEAEIAYRTSLYLRPNVPETLYNLSMILLAQGKFTEAWAMYTARYDPRRKVPVTLLPNLPFPMWTPGTALQGKRIMVWLEQGFGDEIQFVRYCAVLRQQGVSQIVLVCKPELHTLFSAGCGADVVIAARNEMELLRCDFWLPILDLPRVCQTLSLADIPTQLPYLNVPEERLVLWKNKLIQHTKSGNLKVGLVWKGNREHKNDAYRSIPHLSHLADWWDVPGIEFISLQKGQGESEAAQPPAGQALLPLGAEAQDFADTAAIMRQLDLVICVDTAIAHLAGALGVPCWVILPRYGVDWRWLAERDDSPWYPQTLRLFRAGSEPEAQAKQIAAIKTALLAWAKDQAHIPTPPNDREYTGQLLPMPSLGSVAYAQSLQKQRDFHGAVVAWQAVLARKPQSVQALTELSICLRHLDRLVAAEAAVTQVLAIMPNNAPSWMNLAVICKEQGKWAEAETAYRRALALEPDNGSAHMGLGMVLLSQGRFAEGWTHYDGRYQSSPQKPPIVPPPRFSFPMWQGESLQGKSILIWPEQGFGDKFQFVRFLPELKARGASRVTLVCSPALGTIFQGLNGVDQLVVAAEGEQVALELHDYWSMLLSLPRYCQTDLATIPARLPYLLAEAQRQALWSPRLPTAGLRVGLVWKGRPNHGNDFRRSLPHLSALAPLWQVPGVSFISLQKGEGEAEAKFPPAGQTIVEFASEIKDFADTAAIISQLDLVITVDSAIAHLTGALNKPCWVLLPDAGVDWRWLLERGDSPWYPGVMRLFRQQPGAPNWDVVITELVNALFDQLSATLARQGRSEEARAYGRQHLLLQDKRFATKTDVVLPPLPPRRYFNPEQRERNVIAFALLHNTPAQLKQAIENIQAARYLYPCWTCRFYVPAQLQREVGQTLRQAGAEVFVTEDYGLSAFPYPEIHITHDSNVDFFLIRDVNCILNIRERVAVDTWLNSEQHFHLMRDCHTHNDLIPPGLWGGTGGLLPSPTTLFANFYAEFPQSTNTISLFLQSQVWPLIRRCHLTHDSLFGVLGAIPFPVAGQLPSGDYVGRMVFNS